ncbi:MAG: AAA family ATPase, partial [Nostocoides sp.]
MPLRRLVGRDADLARLDAAVDLPGRGGGVVVLSGDAGIGKSRILTQLLEDAGADGWRTAVGHCVGQAGSALPYLPFIELLSTLQAEAPDVVAAVLEVHPRLAGLLPGHGRSGTLTHVLPDDSVLGGDRAASQGVVAESVHALLSALGADRPTLVVVEDVNWADRSSRDLLTLLLTRGFPTPVGLVVSYRSDDLHRQHPLHETLAVWARIAGVEHVDLRPLPDDAIIELIGDFAPAPQLRRRGETSQSVEMGRRAIAQRAGGNPFFAEELAASAVAGLPVGGGLRRVLEARIDDLGGDAQQVVRAVSLKTGRSVGHELLARVVDLPDGALDAAVAEAIEHHVLDASWVDGYAFRHALLGETVAESLLPGQRLRLHRAYAAALADQPDLAPAHELACHAAAAGDLSTAIVASRRAAESALRMGGPREALGHLERALEWLDEDDTTRDQVTLRAADAALAAGDTVRSVNLLRDRIEHPGTTQHPADRADLLAAYANRSRLLDLPVDSDAITREAVALLPPDRDERRAEVLIARLQYLVDAHKWSEISSVAEDVTALAEDLGLRQPAVEVRTILARVVETQDDLDSAERQVLAALAEVASSDDPIQVRMLHYLATIAHRRGDLPAALARYDEGVAVARRLGRDWAPFGMECRLIGALTAYELGDWDGVLSRLDISREPVPEPNRSLYEAAGLTVAAGRGRTVDAAALRGLREWWTVDGLSVILTVNPGIDLLGDSGDVEGALDLASAGIAVLDRTWGRFQAITRMAALLAGQAATAVSSTASPPSPHLRTRLESTVAELVERSRANVARALAMTPDPDRGDEAGESADALSAASREMWAWARRAEAEWLRLRVALADQGGGAGVGDASSDGPVDAQQLVAAWRSTVEAFDAYGHVFESARSRARLAAALRRSGDEAGSRREAASARAVAQRLGAAPLLRELDALATSAGPSADDPFHLTPREEEVLGLVARGLSNGQIGKQLFISTKTVSVHVSNLLAKLGAATRTEAAAIAYDRGLLPVE